MNYGAFLMLDIGKEAKVTLSCVVQIVYQPKVDHDFALSPGFIKVSAAFNFFRSGRFPVVFYP